MDGIDTPLEGGLSRDTRPDGLRGRFQQIAVLSKQAIPAEQFFAAVLHALGHDLRWQWAAVWTEVDRQWRIASGGVGSEDEPVFQAACAALQQALQQDRGGCHASPGPGASLLVTLPIAGHWPAALQVALPPPGGGGSPPDRRYVDPAVVELLEAYGQLCEDFDRNHRLHHLQRALNRHQTLLRLVDSVHATIDAEQSAREIVAATIAWTGAAQASLLAIRGGRMRVLAVSGLATIDPRSPAARALSRLAAAVGASGQPLRYRCDDAESAQRLAPQLLEPLNAYIDWSHAPGLVVLPLKAGDASRLDPRPAADDSAELVDGQRDDPERLVGVLVAECGDDLPLPRLDDDLHQLTPYLIRPLDNAQQHSGLPLRRLGELLRRLGQTPLLRTSGRAGSWLGVGVLLVTALVVIPAPLKIDAPGTLQPADVHHAYAPRDGVVAEVWVEHDQRVVADQPLLRLDAPDLELQWRRTLGAIESTEQELRAAEAARRRGGPAGAASRDEPGSRAASESRLQAVLDSYRKQHQLLQDEREGLTLHSPFDGQVLTWQVRQTLLGRPVQRGQRLLRVAAENSRWTLLLELPDRDAGHLLAARESLGESLRVSYVLATDPQRRRQGTLVDMSGVTDLSAQGTPAVELVVAIDHDDLQVPRAGAQVRASIHCGHRPLGYVWLHRFWDTLRWWW